MAKKIVTSAEGLASLDLLIADKKEKNTDFTAERYWIIIIIFDGIGISFPPRPIIDDFPAFGVADRVSHAVFNVLKGASVEELVHLRESIEVKKR
ncbi:MAG TPA: hypothetical protein VGI43_02760 [Mucilaginibacter sp.]